MKQSIVKDNIIRGHRGKEQKLCSYPGCPHTCKAKGYCINHFIQLKKHGDDDTLWVKGRKPYTHPVKCKVCERLAYCRGLCERHYKKLLIYGNPIKGIHIFRDNDYNHPLSNVWERLVFVKADEVCDRWLKSFKFFVLDVGEKPLGKVYFKRIDESKKYGPNNFKWVNKKELVRESNYVKLDVHKVKIIKILVRQGVKKCKIAHLFKVHPSLITRISQGKNWGDIKV